MAYQYGNPLSIVNVFMSAETTRKVIESIIEDVVELAEKNKDDPSFIPPIVYNDKGKSFNMDYNYMIHSVAWYTGDESIEYDFGLTTGGDEYKTKYARFLVCSILEEWYELVWLNPKSVDLSRFKTMKKFDISKKFFHPICVKNGENLRYFSAVPFNSIRLKKFISEEFFMMLKRVTDSAKYEQVVFGEHQLYAYKRANALYHIDSVFIG